MQKILAYLLLSSLAVIGACASTTQPDPDGQTHWMTQCDENADCGELSCICGVCTELCTASDDCSIGDDAEASCERSDSVLDTTDCSLAHAAARVCVPLCEGQSDCNSVASDLTCTSDAVCAIEGLPNEEGDGSVPEEPDGNDNDAAVEEERPLPPDAGPVTPIELACDEDGNLDGTGPFEIVASGEIGGGLSIAPDGTVFGMGSPGGSGYNNAFRVVDGELDAFGMELWELQRMLIHGEDLITGKSNGSEATIAMTNLETQEKLTLARKDAQNVTALTADEDAVYWHAQLEEADSGQIWRSPRVPGESVLLAETDGLTNGLVLLNDYVYFFSTVDGGSYELIRVAKDGSGGSAQEALQVPANTGGMLTDGQYFFFLLIGEKDDLGNPLPGERGIVRMDPDTSATETVIDTGEDQPARAIIGGPYVYWTTEHGIEDFKPIVKLWRAASNGSTTPEQLGTLESYVEWLTDHNGELYWVSTCRIGNDGTTKSHIVKIIN